MRPTFSSPSALLALFVTTLAPPAVLAQQSAAPSAERIFEAIGVREGSTVCEIGAGIGTLSIAAAKAVGRDGRIFTSELGESRVQKLGAAVDASGLSHITVVAGDPDKTNFPDEACDALFMRDVYHHFTNPARINTAIHAAVKPGGLVAVIDFTPPDEEAAPADRAKDGMHGVYPDTVIRELKEAGFESVSSERGKRWFVVVVSRPHGRAEGDTEAAHAVVREAAEGRRRTAIPRGSGLAVAQPFEAARPVTAASSPAPRTDRAPSRQA